ncbi:MAG TPA: translation initiation factor [Chitinophagales bacterium]|nr:translation initiation factor [Chitinophagales bacterium]
MSKKTHSTDKIVYSTNPDYKAEEENGEGLTPVPAQQTLYVALERLKGGKVATIVENFIGKEADLENLGKTLKSKCGVGGTVKEGIILIQGEQRDKIIGILNSMGYKTKKKGG